MRLFVEPSDSFRYLLFVLIIALSACTDRPEQSEIISVDGLEVLHNYTPVYQEEQILSVPEDDVLVIDEEQAGLPAGVFIASTADVAAGDGGEIILLDSRSRRVFIFGNDGKYLRSFGRVGSGPGEFNSPYRLARLSRNRILISESMDSKAQIFDLQGSFLQQLTYPMTSIRCIASDGEDGFFLSDRATQRKTGETGSINGTILYRLNSVGEVIPFRLPSGEQDTLEIARYVQTGDERFPYSTPNTKNLLSLPDGSAIVAGLNYTFYHITEEGRIAGFRRVGEPYIYPRWYQDAVRMNWEQRGASGNPPVIHGFHIFPNAMAVDDRGHLWTLPMDGYSWTRASSIEDRRKDGTFVLDEFSSEGLWLRHIQIQLPEPYFGFMLSDAAHGYLYGTTFVGNPEDEIRMPIKFKRP